MPRCCSRIERGASCELASAPAAPDRESCIVAQLEHFVALFHFDGDDRRLAIESDLGAFDFNLVFGLDFDVLILQVPAGTGWTEMVSFPVFKVM